MKYLKRDEKKDKKKTVPVWLFAIGSVLYCEILFHLWVMEEFSAGRFAAVLCFGLGFGGLLAQFFSFIGHKNWGKWVAVAVMALVNAMYVVEYFIKDAYVTFMPLTTLLSGAQGVATDFGDVVMGLVVRDFWRIIVILLPVAAYAIFGKPAATSWRTRWFGLVVAVAAYLSGFGIVGAVGVDTARMGDAYNFDSAIRCFGVSMAFTMDAFQDGTPAQEEESFVMVAPEPEAPTVAVQEEVPEETEPVVYEPNVLPLDFAALAETEKNDRVASIHSYVTTVQPSMQNEYTGLFKGKNLIMITAEAFSKEAIDPELTPTLYRLANEGIRFDDYYQPMWGGSTTTGEFSIITGLVASGGATSMKESLQQYMFLSMGNQLKNLGYYSAAYHNHNYGFYDRQKTHPAFGYENYMGLGNGMEEGVTDQWPESDMEMMSFTVDKYIDQQPFSIYYMTVSGHCGYNFQGNKMSKKHEAEVQNMDASTKVKAYMATQMELDQALEILLKKLEEAGIMDDTVIVLSTDHYPYGLELSATWGNKEDYIAELYGYDPKNITERDHSGLIIWSGCLEDMDLVVEEPVYSLDILPTLSNLFGLEYDSRLLVGRDVLADTEPLVLWYNYTWKTTEGVYDSETGQFTPAEGKTVDEAYVERIKALVKNKIYYSREVQNTDYFDYVWEALQAQ